MMGENYMEKLSLEELLGQNSYPGRGIVIGKSEDGASAVLAYFIMGRSVNSRNRIFVENGEGIRTQAFDPDKVSDPSLIIYAPVRVLGNKTIVTNGDQTDTIYDGIDNNQTFEESLRIREFEPDAPNYTPRISGILHVNKSSYQYAISILKSSHGNPDSCCPFRLEGDIDMFTNKLWNSLNEENKVSLFVRYINLASGTYESRIINKNK